MSDAPAAVPTMIGVDEALARIVTDASTAPRDAVVTLAIADALGRVLARDLVARWSLPSAATSTMDGFALRAADLRLGGELPLVGESAAGHPMSAALAEGCAARVSTGALVPEGADCVIPREEVSAILEGAAPRVRFAAEAIQAAAPGRFVRAEGSDVREGSRLVAAGEPLRAGSLALLASAGHAELPVFARPRVGVLCTGDELVAIGRVPAAGQLVATNGMMLAAQIRAAGGDPVELPHAADTIAAHDQALAAAADCDLLLTSGGISVGEHDLVYARLLARGFTPVFRKVRLQPGKPTSFGLLPREGRGPLPVLALPGNPASTYVAFELFGRPLVRRLAGLSQRYWSHPRRTVTLAAPARGNHGRAHFVRARLDGDQATPLADQDSGALRSLSGHDALLALPAGRLDYAAGERVEALWLEGLV